MRALCRHFGISERCKNEMARVVNAAGIESRRCGRQRTHSIREEAFDTITDESAYWTGFLMADGSIHLSKLTGHPEKIQLALSPCDVDHVQAFLDFVGSNSPIKLTDRADDRPGWGRATLNYVNIYSTRLVQSLIDLGVTPRKSLTAKADPRLATNPHFWRGVVDGDGFMFTSSQGAFTLGLCSASEAFIRQFVDFCRLHVDFKANPRLQKIWYFRLAHLKAKAIARVLYSPPGPVLARKAAIARSVI